MATDPISGARYALETDSGDVALWMQRGVNDLSTQGVPRFATATARDNAYSAAITAGTITSIPNGAKCVVNGVPYRRINGNWQIDRDRVIQRVAVLGSGSGSIPSGGSTETGVTTGATLSGGSGGTFTLYEACTVNINAAMRAGPTSLNVGAALCYVRIDGALVGNVAASRSDSTVACAGTVALAAGSHSISLRVDANSGSASWIDGIVTLTECTAE